MKRPTPACLFRTIALAFALLTPNASGVRAQEGPDAPEPKGSAVERAEALYRGGDADGALTLLETHLERRPEDYDARWRAARAALSVGLLEGTEEEQNDRYRRGMVHGEAAVQLRPDGVEGLFWLTANQGHLAIQLPPRASAAAALEVYDRAHRILALDSLHAGAHNVLGKIGFEIMRLSRIERFLARTFVGNEAFRRATWEDTERHQRRAVELDPSMPLFRFDLGRTYLHIRRYDLAERELRTALDLPDRHPGDVLFKRQAAEALASALERRAP